jgi:hypothetical protein
MISAPTPHILVGDCRGQKTVDLLRKHDIGRMVLNRSISLYDEEKWGFDNGAYTDWTKGKSFDETRFLRSLEMAQSLGTPYLAVVPDIVAGGNNSLDFSMSWLSRLPADWPWYLAVQDGMDTDKVVQVIDQFSGIFLGGSDKYKSTALFWSRVAHHFNKKFHFARAGTYNKIRHAFEVEADSLDSAFPLWTKARLKEFIGWKNQKPWENEFFWNFIVQGQGF